MTPAQRTALSDADDNGRLWERAAGKDPSPHTATARVLNSLVRLGKLIPETVRGMGPQSYLVADSAAGRATKQRFTEAADAVKAQLRQSDTPIYDSLKKETP